MGRTPSRCRARYLDSLFSLLTTSVVLLVVSPTYHSFRVAQGQVSNSHAPTSGSLVVYSSLYLLGMGRWSQTRETALIVLVSQTLIPVFSSEPVVPRKSPRPRASRRFHGRSRGRCLEVWEETLALQNLPFLLSAPEDLAVLSRRTAVSSDTAVGAAFVRSTSNQTFVRMAQPVCLPG